MKALFHRFWRLALGVALALALLPNAHTESQLPDSTSVLVINQLAPSWQETSERTGRQVELLLRHFTPNTVRISQDAYTPGKLADFDRVVVVGNDAANPLPSPLLHDIAQARRPVLWLGYGLDRLPLDLDATFGFAPGYATDKNLPEAVEYQGQRYPATLEYYQQVRIATPAVQVLASYIGQDEPTPYIVRSGDLWYVNGLPNLDSDYPNPQTDAPTLVFADVLHEFFETSVPTSRRAVIRLEDVSVHVDPAHLIETVDYLSSEHIPFVIGLIPAQRFEDGTIIPLQQRPEFVRVLRYAQDHGATIALHGYHHTFGSGEDFEFWDPARHAPLAGETRDMYAAKIEDGIRTLRDLGIEPRLWETPHYAASPLAYQVFSDYFSHAIENREPVSWLPYTSGPDDYGQMLIPETLGYINPAEGWTVEAQLQRARLLKIVRDSWAVGFFHPVSIPLDELKSMVGGLRREGYSFADLRSLPLEVRYDYHPSALTMLSIWLSINPRLSLWNLNEWLAQRFGWWSAVRQGPWSAILVIGLTLVFLLRLREQWQPPKAAAASLVESSQTRRTPMRARALVLVVLVLVSAGSFAAGAWRSGAGIQTMESPDARVAEQWPARNPALRGPTTPTAAASVASDGWELSVYYTAVERYHSGSPAEVHGCLVLDCVNGTDSLGTFPSDFVQAVKDEGSGRITSGPHAGQFLNWSIDVGYWLDSAPRDARGIALEPFVSAAADPSIPYVTPFTILDCGVDIHNGAPIDPSVCARISSANWIVRDRFTVGAVGKHMDLYIGEEDRANFLATNQNVIHVKRARIALPPER
jgi:hypothetical protein